MPKVSQEHLDARRAQIIAGARKAFAELGYDGATVTKLEEATGLSRGAIFHYFDDKKALFIELAMDTSLRFGDVLVERGLPGAMRAIAEENPEWLAVLIETESRMRHDTDFVERFEARAADEPPRIQNWFEAAQAEGTLRDDLSHVEIGRFVTAVVNGLAIRVASGDPFDIEVMIQLLNDAVSPRT